MQDLEQYRSWLILKLLPDIGRGRFNALIRHFGSADAVLEASPDELKRVEGLGAMARESILSWRDLVDVDAEMEEIEKHGVSLTCVTDEDFPANLGQLDTPPPLLYYKGSLEAIDAAAVAIIGARKMSRYGHEVTRKITRGLVEAGVTIVSGLALGVDSEAHRMAIDAGGRTLAVLGNGLSRVYPVQHKHLAEEVVENGALISEMPMAAKPDAGSFPQRNSIIAGLSLGVAVMEAGAKSGTSITIGYALDDNRGAYAVPGDITRVNSLGTNKMIKEGARLVTCAEDILVDLRNELRHFLDSLPDLGFEDEETAPTIPQELNEVERLIYESLELDPMVIDDISESVSARGLVTQTDMMSALLNLEIKGLIQQEPGKRFRRLR